MNDRSPRPTASPTTAVYHRGTRPIGIQTMVAAWQEKIQKFGPLRTPSGLPPVMSPALDEKTSTAASGDWRRHDPISAP